MCQGFPSMLHPRSPFWSLACDLHEQSRVEVVEEVTLYESAAASYSHFVERVREVILDSVLEDVERP